ncbi:MAG: hypothetical protein CMJ23_09595 [Phycisphaerae bacterium]|nr:hypothetical protein [Phycisphaerae bacterium]
MIPMIFVVLLSAITQSTPPTLDLARAMADPAWLGAFPERIRWTIDGRLVFDRRVGETEERVTFVVDPDTGAQTQLDLEARESLVSAGVWNPAGDRMAAVRDGDLILFDPSAGSLQLTRTTARESSPRFLVDGRLSFRRDGVLIIRDLETGIEVEPAEIRFSKAPAAPEEPEGLAAAQRRLFTTLAQRAENTEAGRRRSEEKETARTFDVTGPVHLPPEDRETARHLSPDGRWLLLEVAPRSRPEARRDDMPMWVTDDGFIKSRELRPKVGTRPRTAERLVLIDLQTATSHEVDLDDLPDRRVDRLQDIRLENEAWRTTAGTDATGTTKTLLERLTALARSTAPAAPSADGPSAPPRAISVIGVEWNPKGDLAAVMLRSNDNKDRWIVAVDPARLTDSLSEESTADAADDEQAATSSDVTLVEHLHDPNWVNWAFNEMGWMRDGSELWFLSEASGWSDLLTWDPDAGASSRVSGAFEIRGVKEHPRNGTLFFRSNRGDPSIWRLEAFDPTSGWSETIAGGSGMVERFEIAPDGSRVACLESTLERPAELFVVDLPTPGTNPGRARRLTDSRSEIFASLDWTPATLVDIPSRTGRDIRGRLHLPPTAPPSPSGDGRPAVLFVHGAGYLQNGHAGWSRYFREGFFHDLLAREGFVVLDLDYRASAGYGRDWRTAIARDMGRCELDDYEDGIAWLADQHGVDPSRVGMYGGSYGGFTTLMGLFTRPGMLQAGAALRPVTDWTFYNDGYTANILNQPQDDPLAYRRSSPIEHAAGLDAGLLVCHGMVDDNVPYSDSVRLAQRLIELGKVDWELASYPVEAHGFRETSSWLDEYRRIRELFHRHLQSPPPDSE